jgi:hypothetical protein
MEEANERYWAITGRSSQRSVVLDPSYGRGVERGECSIITFDVLCAICLGLEGDIAALTKCFPHPQADVYLQCSV